MNHAEMIESCMRMLRQRAEDGKIHILDEGVEAFIEDALSRIVLQPLFDELNEAKAKNAMLTQRTEALTSQLESVLAASHD